MEIKENKKRGRPNILDVKNDKNYSKKYYENNKEKLIKHSLEKKKCICCNTEIMISNFSHHNKTLKHKYNELKYQIEEKELPNKEVKSLDYSDKFYKLVEDHNKFMDDYESESYPYILNDKKELTHVYDQFYHKWSKEDAIKQGLLLIKEKDKEIILC